MEKIEKFKSELLDDIFQYIQCISIFVYKKKIYYLIDYKENFELNAKISFDIYLREGIITKEQYNYDYKNYRNGIWQLTKDNFESYLQSDSVIVLKKDELKELMFQGFTSAEAVRLYSVVENKRSYNDPILHMDWDRCHEDYVYDGWFAKAMDFGYLIPDEFCYWKIEGRDYWKFGQL